MLNQEESERLGLPKSWPQGVESAVLQTIALAFKCMTYVRGWAVNSPIHRVRLTTEKDQLQSRLALAEEVLRIVSNRLARINPLYRPHYLPTERMEILELKAANQMSIAPTARRFLVSEATIASWMKRVDEQGVHALVQILEPVNKFPVFVRYMVKRLKVLCPTMGKVKIAQILARVGLHLGSTTVDRMIKEEDNDPKGFAVVNGAEEEPQRIVTANYANHVWQVDLMTVPTTGGFWVPWLPLSLPQIWPFCWWIAFIVDHYSRCGIGFTVFKKPPVN